MTPTPPARPVMRYHGGKFRIASWVVRHFPAHTCYVEPFCGAASVLMAKPRAPAECINDLDDRVVNVFRVLRSPTLALELARRLALTPFARTEFDAAYEPAVDHVDDAAKALVLSFMGQGSDGVTRGYRTGFRCKIRNAYNKSLPSSEWASWPAAIPAFVDRLRGVAIERTDALALIARLDSPDTLFYVDPPYPHGTRGASRGRHGYRHELTDAGHRALAAVLHRVRGMVVLSGYPCALYDAELYPAWDRSSCRARADRQRPSTEVLWLNPAASGRQAQGRLIA